MSTPNIFLVYAQTIPIVNEIKFHWLSTHGNDLYQNDFVSLRPIKMVTTYAVQGTWIHTGGSGRENWLKCSLISPKTRTRLKERRMFTPNIFLVYARTIPIVNEIKFHWLSTHRNDLYQNDFVSLRPIKMVTT